MLPTPPVRPSVRPTGRPSARCRCRMLMSPVLRLPLVWGGLAGVGCLWEWAGVGLLTLRLLLLLPLLLLPLLPELLLLPLLPLALWLLPGGLRVFRGPRGCIVSVRAKLCGVMRNQRESARAGSPRGRPSAGVSVGLASL